MRRAFLVSKVLSGVLLAATAARAGGAKDDIGTRPAGAAVVAEGALAGDAGGQTPPPKLADQPPCSGVECAPAAPPPRDLVVAEERPSNWYVLDAGLRTHRDTFIGLASMAAVLVAGIRGKASYDDSGRRFGLLGRAVGMGMAGKAMNLIYDTEYKEADADFESCFPIKKPIKAAGIDVHQLPAGRALTLIHRGPYDRIGESYGRLFEHLSARKLTATLPSREVYLKGPGMLFKGNPKNYLTEIQILIDG